MKRRNVINTIFDYFNIDNGIIDEEPIFLTNTKEVRKLQSPGKWTENKNVSVLKNIQVKYNIPNNNLFRIGWAFNAKPDLLIISGDNCLIMEFKIESKVGKNDYGYNQYDTQYDIIELIKLTVPFFKNKNFEIIRITKEKDAKNIIWSEFLDEVGNNIVKKHFTKIFKEY
jgi:hypothetical protein